jgi:hypothetical protein
MLLVADYFYDGGVTLLGISVRLYQESGTNLISWYKRKAPFKH